MDFYYLPPSPPSRAVLLLAKRLGIEFNLKTINIIAGEHLTPEFAQVRRSNNIRNLIPEISTLSPQ
jgi:glutathione S-transferase